MITTHKNNLIARCKQRGYELSDVMACVIKQNGDIWTIDENHASYPKPKAVTENAHEQAKALDIGDGPGTELKKLLKIIGITASPTCGCNAKAKHMNEMGVEWCEENIETIVDWLKEESKKRHIPFFRYPAKKIINLAIHRARKKIK